MQLAGVPVTTQWTVSSEKKEKNNFKNKLFVLLKYFSWSTHNERWNLLYIRNLECIVKHHK